MSGLQFHGLLTFIRIDPDYLFSSNKLQYDDANKYIISAIIYELSLSIIFD